MKFLTEKHISKLNLISGLMIVGLLVVSMGYVSISKYYKNFQVRTQIFEQDYFTLTKEKIKASVEIQIRQIESKNVRVEKETNENLVASVGKIYDIIESTYQNYTTSATKKELVKIVLKPLQAFEMHETSDHYFVCDIKGNILIHSPPKLLEENKNYLNFKNSKGEFFIKDIISIANKDNGAFYSYHWKRFDDTKKDIYPKIVYLKKFKPLDLIIVAGTYPNDTEQLVKSKMLARMNSIAGLFEQNTYLFAYELMEENGKARFKTLVHHDKNEIGKEFSSETVDAEESTFLKQLLTDIKEYGEIFISHMDSKPGETKKIKKMSYFKFYPRWNWIIARGFYAEDLANIINKRKQEFKKDIGRDIKSFLAILIVFIILSVMVSVASSRGINGIITDYKDKVTHQNEELRKREQQLIKLNKILDETGRKDPLTGLSNRRDMDEKLTHQQALFKRSKRPFAIIMADIDYFKSINDSYGHDMGDNILIWMAKFLKDIVRGQDIVSRWGGEEFLLLLPETNLEGASTLAEKIRAGIADKSIEQDDIRLNVTLTLGVSVYDKETKMEEVIKQADDALYKGKRNGRNQVVTHS